MKSLALAVLLTFMVVGINAQPPACGNTDNIDWVPAEYQTDQDSLSDPDGTPLGFRRGLVIPNPENMVDPPCLEFTLQNSIQYIEILAQTVSFSGSYFCVTIYDSSLPLTEEFCGQGQVDFCGNIAGSSTTLWALFNCESMSCDQSDVAIYYRVVLSDSLETDLENWCTNNRTQDYPSNLLTQVPPTNDITPPPIHTDGAMGTHPQSLITLLAFLFAIAYLRHYVNL